MCIRDSKLTEQGYFTYDGTGFVQFRDPRDLRRAWNSRQIREKTKFTCQRMGIPEDQEGLVLEKGGKRMVLDPSYREFAVAELCNN
eukprot:2102548-Karenia_brevis.AAC.1